MQGELGRCVGDQLRDHLRIEPHAQRPVVDFRAVLGEKAPGIAVQHLDADIAQDRERGLVDTALDGSQGR